ncbi:hypothetical protein ATCC90586_001858 [Pythium insidiosum]|nr:hypothetical protein ATCC90586_001858 [Pythium insidiosum]
MDAPPVKMEVDDDVAEQMKQQETETQQLPQEEEEFKLIVLNYGKWKDAKSMDAFLRERGVAFRKVQKSRQLSFGFIHFYSAEERDAAMPLLRELEWTGEKMDVKPALPRRSMKPMRGQHKKRQRDEPSEAATTKGGDDDDAPEPAGETDAPAAAPAKTAREVVAPWADVPYKEQLERKEVEMKKVLVKIVRQTRKEYFKKEKRMNGGDRRHNKKQKKDAEAEDEYRKTNIPTWLTSHGSLFLVMDDVLYTRAHEASASTPWTRLADATGIVSVVSFGGELVGATREGEIRVLMPEAAGLAWNALCRGPGEPIVSLASLRGSLLCCTDDGKIMKQEGMGRFATGDWKLITTVPGAKTIVIHSGFVYAFCPDVPAEQQWHRAALTADALDQLAFEPFVWDLAQPDQLLGMCSHDHQVIALCGRSLVYAEPQGAVEQPIPLVINQSDSAAAGRITGFASHKGLCCPMDSIHASPVTEGYRNKCEFSIGFDAEGKPCVGFRLGLFRDGSVIVNAPTNCENVSAVMEQVCAAVQQLVETSDFPVYDVKTQEGVWRLLTVRHSERTGQLMIILQINPKNLSEEDVAKVRALTKAHLVGEEATPANVPLQVTSLYIQEYAGVSAASEDDPLIHLHGSKTIEEILLGLRFSVSPSAFFQVNTQGAETLYSLVKRHANADEQTLLYDVCCGTGTIGICAAAGVGKVVGIEICKAATDDAAVNAERNSVSNVSFVNSKAEDVMRDLLKTKQEGGEDATEANLKRVVAIVDPPRAGLHHQVLRSLRSCPPVDRIVYVSCNPTGSLIQDAITLCGPKTKSITGQAFRPVHAIPVDMFPHTPHCEMIIVFDRVAKEDSGH